MRIKIITAVTNKSFERQKLIINYLNQYINRKTEIEFETIEYGFPSVENEFTAAFNIPEIIKVGLRAEKDGCDGIFINCFDDPGVFALREIVNIPVLGGYIPAITTAMSIGERIGIITTDRNGILSEERKSKHHGFRDHIMIIEEVGLGVLELKNEDVLLERLYGICKNFNDNYRIQAVSFGCTAMFYIIEKIRRRLENEGNGIQIIEPLVTGIKTLESIIDMKLTNTLGYNLSFENLNWYDEKQL